MTSKGATIDVGAWLRGLGLGQYEAAFRENEIDETVLASLTHETLKEIGVTPVGHRLKLLDAIRVPWRTDTSAKAPSADAASTSAAPSVRAEDRAERRQVTVMFSDLVGSTALSARMDPEDLREVISAYQKCVAETVQRFDGFVAKYMGDGVLVYFGYPHAHEDDAERAVRAGLELIRAVGALKSSAPLQTRVGIATGLVVVGDLIGSGEAQERGIVGETPNLAARLQAMAEPNTVVIAESTRRLLGNLFELQDLGARELKGIAEPVRAWAALRPSSVEGRFEALHATRPHCARGAGRRTRIAAAALVKSKDWRRSGGAPVRRGRYWQVAAHGGAAGTPRRRTAHALALFLLAAAHRQRALSDHQPDGARSRVCARRHRASEARQTRHGAGADLDLKCRTRRCSPRCCRCRTMDAIPHSILPRSSAGRERWKRSFPRWRRWHGKIRC